MRYRKTALLLLALVVTAPAAGAQAVARWGITPELRIGHEDRRNYALTIVSDLEVDGAGRIYIAQPVEQTIRVYTRTGAYVRSIGRSGAGPGEFGTVERLGWRGDTLYATDPRLDRATLFSTDGRTLATVARSRDYVTPELGPASPVGLLANGAVVGRPAFPRKIVDGGERGEVPLVRQSRAGTILGPLAVLNDVAGAELRIRFEPNGTFYMSSPIPTQTLWDLAPDGSALVVVERQPSISAEGAAFTVTKIRADGSQTYSREYAYTPTPVSRTVRDSLAAHVLAYATGFSKGRFAMGEGVRRGFSPPPYEPPVTALVYGRDGTIWLRRESLGREQVRWMVLDPAGVPVATLQAPAALEIHQADRSAVWGVVKDEMAVSYVVRYRVGPAIR